MTPLKASARKQDGGNDIRGSSSSSSRLLTRSVVLLGLVSSSESFSSKTTASTATTSVNRRISSSNITGGSNKKNPLRVPFQFKTAASMTGPTTSPTQLQMSSRDTSSHPYAHYYGTSGSTARQNHAQNEETLGIYGYMESMDMMGGGDGIGMGMGGRAYLGPPPAGGMGGFGGGYMDSLAPDYYYGMNSGPGMGPEGDYIPPPPPPSMMRGRPDSIMSMQDSDRVRERRDGVGGLSSPERSFYNNRDRLDGNRQDIDARQRAEMERYGSRYEYLRPNSLANNEMMDRLEGRHVLDRLDDLLMEHDELRRRLMDMENRVRGGNRSSPSSPGGGNSSSWASTISSTESLQRQVDDLIRQLQDEQGLSNSGMMDTVMQELRTVQQTLSQVQQQGQFGQYGPGNGEMGDPSSGIGGMGPNTSGPPPFNPQVQPPPPSQQQQQQQQQQAPPQVQAPPPPPPAYQQQQQEQMHQQQSPTPPQGGMPASPSPASKTRITSSDTPPSDMQGPPSSPPPPPPSPEGLDVDEMNGSASLNSFQQRQMNMKDPPQPPPRDTSAPRKTLLRDRGQLQNEDRAGQIPYGYSEPPSQGSGGGPPPQGMPGVSGGSGVSINGDAPNSQQAPRSSSGYTPRGGIPPQEDSRSTMGSNMPNNLGGKSSGGGGGGGRNGVVSNTGMNIRTGTPPPGMGSMGSGRGVGVPSPPPPQFDDDDEDESLYPKGGVNTFEPGQGPAAQQRAYQRRGRGGSSGGGSTFGGSGGATFGGGGGSSARRGGGGGGGIFGSGSGFQGGTSTGGSRHGKSFGEESGTMSFSDGADGGRCFLT
eukprot:CAMPEP_0113493790 /NCGR_PEP_ID=MMETSP0014_2-20120614/28775_1 /TAXON_ID=2857 /ORGANISM="Nitzschia sp." /LENGTH=813 /DNA_ID=CAMNT_0000387667 /DNA_START=206 /DNA_END=2647 /DNA_ORIENTATION=+ /assembly_acc=CAM_ASM_000159